MMDSMQLPLTLGVAVLDAARGTSHVRLRASATWRRAT